MRQEARRPDCGTDSLRGGKEETIQNKAQGSGMVPGTGTWIRSTLGEKMLMSDWEIEH